MHSIALVVEDEFFIRICVADALAEAGWQVLEAATGDAAVALMESGRNIDLLITDICLPGERNGWDVAERFRALNGSGLVLYFSATQPDTGRQVSHSRFVTKPGTIKELILALNSLQRTSQSN